ncbi:MAG: iron ABC transporter permease [Alphaproteobacteria bacterium]|nr:iron ABC transporter permease [Alphaproteobacteria bacterium]
MKVLTAMLALAALALFALSLATGPGGAVDAGLLRGALSAPASPEALILFEIRLPRALLGLMVGASMGLAGAALQGLLRNPLAEPALIGVTASAALGAVIAFYFGFAAAFAFALPAGGMAGALIAILLIYALAGLSASIHTLILAGVAVNSIAAALTSLALNLAPSPYAAAEILFWLLGSLADRSMEHVQLALLPVLAGLGLLAFTGRALDALTLGEDVAASLGVNLRLLQARIVLGSGLAVGAVTSVVGSVGFIGLVVPHLLRPLAGQRPGGLLLPSALGGAALALAADLLVRLLSGAQELRLGVFTALLGAPFFLWLVLASRREAGP